VIIGNSLLLERSTFKLYALLCGHVLFSEGKNRKRIVRCRPPQPRIPAGEGFVEYSSGEVSVPLILTLSIIPDVDILFKPLIEHRGPTHSIITLLIVFIPFLAMYRRRAVPYILSIASHPLIGDFFIGGNIRLLWPLSNESFGLSISITSPTNVALE
jgi:hypothetical protein